MAVPNSHTQICSKLHYMYAPSTHLITSILLLPCMYNTPVPLHRLFPTQNATNSATVQEVANNASESGGIAAIASAFDSIGWIGNDSLGLTFLGILLEIDLYKIARMRTYFERESH